MQISRPFPDVVHIHFDTQFEQNITLLRPSEHAESAGFKGKVFLLEDFMEYEFEQGGAFTYLEDSEGFNIPSSALDSFAASFHPKSRREMTLLDALQAEPRPFYLIATYGEEANALDHEYAHALFDRSPAYRAEVTHALARYDLAPIHTMLGEQNYHPDVWLDEAQAYMSEPHAIENLARLDVDPRPHVEKCDELREIYERHMAAWRQESSPTA